MLDVVSQCCFSLLPGPLMREGSGVGAWRAYTKHMEDMESQGEEIGLVAFQTAL